MKKLMIFVFSVGVMCFFVSPILAGHVNGYTKSNGTYVSGYNRSSSNNTVKDNYSYKGNTNLYTGNTGSNKYKSSPSSEYYDPYSSNKNNAWKN